MRQAPPAEVRALFAAEGHRAWSRLPQRYGLTFRLQGMVVTCDPRLVESLLVDPAHTRRRSRPHRWISAVTPGAGGLLFFEGERWRRHARAVGPTFTHQHFERFGDLVHAATVAHSERWTAAGGARDLFQAVVDLGADIVLPIGYGLDPGLPRAQRLADHLVGYKQRTMRRDRRGRLDELPLTLGKLLDLPWLARTWADLAARTRRLRAVVAALTDGGAAGRAPELGWIAALAAEDLPPGELADALNHLYGAYNASDFVIAAGLFELARHGEWRLRLRAEAEAVLGDRDHPTRQDLARMTGLADVQREVLRRYPVAMVILRQLGRPLDFEGERLPAGAEVAILPYALHHHPDFWDEPERFDPARWRSNPQPRVPFSYIPFLVGPRKCLGQPLAEWLFALVVTGVLRRVEIEPLVERADLTAFVIPRFAADLPFRARPAGQGGRPRPEGHGAG